MKDCQAVSHNSSFPLSKRNFLLFAAIPEEYKAFLSHIGSWKKVISKHFFLLQSELSNKNLFFVPTGMGFRGAISHWQDIISYVKPDLIISFGFCGELFSSGTGDLFLSCRFIPLPANQFFRPVEQPLRSEILNFCGSHGINIATSISTPVFIPKRNVLKLIQSLFAEHEIARLAMSNVIVDMESAIIANLAARESIPVLSIRASTDTCDEEIPFDVEELLDEKGFVSVSKSVYVLYKTPLLARSFLHFWKTSRRAAEKLTGVVSEFINSLPFDDGLKPPEIKVITDSHKDS